MSTASLIWNWRDGDRVYSRLTTNVGRERFLARLSAVGMLEMVETIHAYFGDRAYGGCGYEVAWQARVRLEDLEPLIWL